MEEVNEEIKNLSILVENVENNSRNKKKYIERQKAMDKIETQLTRPIASKQAPYDDMDDYLMSLKSDNLMSSGWKTRRTRDMNRKALKEMLTQCQFAGPEYQKIFKDKSIAIRPLIRFFKHMVPRRPGYTEQNNFITKSKLQLCIPYTIVYGLDSYPILYYTDDNGFITRDSSVGNTTRVDNPSSRNIARKLNIPEGPKDDRPDENVAGDVNRFTVVMKREFPGETVTNMATPMTRKQVQTLLEQPNTSLTVFQRFVPTKGGKATIARIAWCADRPSFGFMLSNRKTPAEENEKDRIKQLLVDTENLNNLHVYKMSGLSVDDLSIRVQHLAKYVQQKSRQRIRFQEMVCDFIRDDASQWWFIQVKAFIVERLDSSVSKGISSSSFRTNRANYVRMKECKMCLNLYEPQDLSFSMSLKMIYATEAHLKRRATKLAWFDRPEYNSITDTSLWYTFHKVCKNCFDMYLQEQKLARVEVEFARAIGIPVNDKVHEQASILNTLGNRLRSGVGIRDCTNMSDTIKRLKKRGMRMFRFILYLNELRNLPASLMDTFTIRVDVFHSQVIVPVQPLSESHMKIMPIGKLRVFYFFVTDEEVFRRWIRNEDELRVHICVEGEIVATARLELTQFAGGLIDKLDYMTLFSGSSMGLCALRATLGFVKMKDMDLSNVHLTEYDNNIYLPEEDFFTAEPLPDEWMEIIPRLATELPLDQVNRTVEKIGTYSSRSDSPSLPRRPQSATIVRRPSSAFRPTSARSYVSSPGKFPTRPSISSTTPVQSTHVSNSGGITSRTLQIRATSARRSRPEQPQLSSRSFARRRATSASRQRTNTLEQLPTTISTRKVQMASPISVASSRTHSPIHKEQNPSTEMSKPDDKQNDHGVDRSHDLQSSSEIAHLYGHDDFLFRINIRLGTVSDLKSPVDKSWILSLTMFRTIKPEYETFQLLPELDLDFGSCTEELFLSATSKHLQHYFSRERYIIAVLRPKWEPENLLAARVDMSKLEHRDNENSVKFHRNGSKFELGAVQVDQWFALEKKTLGEVEEMLNDLEDADEDEIVEEGDGGNAGPDDNDDNRAGEFRNNVPRIKISITCTKLRSTGEELGSRGIQPSDVKVLSHLEEYGVRVLHHPKLV